MAKNLLQFPRIRFPFHDSFKNLIAGFGIPGRDKVIAQRFVLNLLDPQQLTEAYRGDWVSRKICDVPAFDSCRAWREWQAENEEIEKIEECEKEFGLQRKLMWALSKSRLYGGAALVMGIDGQKFEDELDPETVGKGDLKFVHACTRWMITAGPQMRDITSPWYGEPTYYMRSNVAVPQPPASAPLEGSSLGYKEGETIYIHPSRVVRLIGMDYPDWEMAPDPWGDSVLQTVFEAIRNSDVVASSIAAMITEAKLDVIKVPGLMEMLSTKEGSDRVFDRFSQANVAKSVVNATLIDTAEEWERKQLTFSGMDGVMSMYLMIAAGAADIPATRLLGRSPEGMNATGDSDMRNYYDRLSADQKVRITPALSRLDEVLLRHVFGDRPEDIHYEWSPLWQMDDVQKAAVALQKAQAHKIDVDNGLINPDVLREARQNQVIEDGFYPGIEAAIDEFGIEPDDEDEQANMELDLQMKQAQLTSMKPHNDLDLKMKQAKLKQLQAPKPKVRPRDAGFDPSEPRDPEGKWTSGGGGPSGRSGSWSREGPDEEEEETHGLARAIEHEVSSGGSLIAARSLARSVAERTETGLSGGIESFTQVGAQTGGTTDPLGGGKATPGVDAKLVEAIENHAEGMGGEGSMHGSGDLSEWIMRTHRADVLKMVDASKDKWPIMLLHKGDVAKGIPTVWLLSWSKNDNTSIHDHLGSEVGVSVARGKVANRAYGLPENYFELAKGEGVPIATHETMLHNNGTVTLTSPYIHEMYGTAEPGGKRDVTIHSYYPPLKQMHYFKKGPDGKLYYDGDWDEDRPEQGACDAMPELGCPCCCGFRGKFRDYNPSEPRDPAGTPTGGRWTKGGSSIPTMHSTHPGRNYSLESYVDFHGVIHTSNVEDAARALFEHRKVALNQPREVSTLIMRLGEIAKDMVAEGSKEPIFNLCDVSVSGTNLFCTESKGIPRVQMPQMTDEQTQAFHEHLGALGYGVTLTNEHAAYLRATQDELNGAKVARSVDAIKTNPGYSNRRIIVSKDNYVLDGHHFWAGKLAIDAEDGTLNNDARIAITRIDIPITKLLEECEIFTGGKGKKGVGDAKKENLDGA